jgi:hypothetical protein
VDNHRAPREAGQKKTRPHRVDWSWRHGPVLGAVNAAGGALSVAMVADLAQVSWWWPAVGGAAAAVATTARAAQAGASRLMRTYQQACWAGAGTWTAWAVATTPWSGDALAALAGGTLVAGLMRPGVRGHEQRVRQRRQEDAAAAQRLSAAQDWEARLERVCQVRGAVVEAIEAWPGEVGYTLQVRLPLGGTTWRALAGHADGLAADSDLPAGCQVEIAPGATRGVVLIRVATVDTTVQEVPYPDQTSPLSLTQPLQLGIERTSRPASVFLLEDPMVLVGRRGSGKTNALQVLNADLMRCTDALVWHIDLNGAGMSRPWLMPWLRGQVDEPVIDWVAPTVEEAELLLGAAIEVAKRRKSAYGALMDAVDDDKLPISAEVPAIVVVLDEGAEAVAATRGNARLAGMLEELVSIARATRVQVVASTLRATSDILPPAIKAQAGNRLWLRPDDEHEVAQLLGWRTGISLADVSRPGSGLLRSADAAAVTPVTTWRITPAQVQHLAATLVPRRPHLDAASAAAAGPVWAGRWHRYLAWCAEQGLRTSPRAVPGRLTATLGVHLEPQQRPSVGEGIAGLGAAEDGLNASLQRLREARARAEQSTSAPVGEAGEADLAEAFASIVGAEEWPEDVQDTPNSAKPAPVDGPTLMLQVLTKAGANGLHWQKLLDHLVAKGETISRPTLYRWLSEAQAAGTVTQVRKGYWAASDPQ